LTCEREALQGVCIIFGITSFPPFLEDHQALWLVDSVFPDWCKIKHGWCARVLRIRAQRSHTHEGAPWHTTAQSMLCVHTPSSTCTKLHCTFHAIQLS